MEYPLKVIPADPVSGSVQAENTIFWLKLQSRYQLYCTALCNGEIVKLKSKKQPESLE